MTMRRSMVRKSKSENSRELLTKKQAELTAVLSNLGLTKSSIIGVMLQIDTDDQADEMMDWIADHRETASQKTVIEQLHRINPNPKKLELD